MEIQNNSTKLMQHTRESENNNFNRTEDVFHLGVKTIIKNSDNKILILKAENYWDLPGGRVQINEDTETTASREVAEETGITNMSNIRHIGMVVSSIRISIENKQTVGLIFSFYSGNVDKDTIILSSEHTEYEWVIQQKAIEILEPIYGKAFISMLS